MSSEVESMIEKVSKETGKPVEEIQKQMGERKEKTHGLLSDYGAIYAVAKSYGIDLSESEVKLTGLDSLVPSSSVNIAGRVKAVFSAREFKRKDGSAGKFASIVLIDTAGEVRIVLWDQNTEIVKKLRVGDTLLVRNGFAKENRGQLEVHAGNLSNLMMNPVNLDLPLPEIEETHSEVASLTTEDPSVNILLRVNSYYPQTEFDRSDGSKGRRASFIGQDTTGTVRVVLWDASSDMEIKEGDFVKLENGYTRQGLNEEIELHAGNRSRILLSDQKLDLPKLAKKAPAGKVKISKVTSDMRNFTLEARVLKVYEPREYSKGQMSSLVVGDDSGTIRLVLWNEQAETANKVKEGDAILVSNAYSRPNLSDEPEAHLGKYGELKIDDKLTVPTVGQISASMTEEKSIKDLDANDRFIKITGKVVDVEQRSLIYMTCGECGKKVQNLGGEWMCDACGVVEASPNMLASVILEDSTANIRAVAFRNQAETLLGMDIEEAMNLIGESQDEAAPITSAREKIVGKTLSLTGRVKFNDYSEQLEFLVEEVG
ncbi:OB-fold nucleic acid binding domain-containing protein [Candidatus Altiarchaeota archaeon]